MLQHFHRKQRQSCCCSSSSSYSRDPSPFQLKILEEEKNQPTTWLSNNVSISVLPPCIAGLKQKHFFLFLHDLCFMSYNTKDKTTTLYTLHVELDTTLSHECCCTFSSWWAANCWFNGRDTTNQEVNILRVAAYSLSKPTIQNKHRTFE